MTLKLINLEEANASKKSVFPAIIETFAAIEYAIDMHVANGVKAAIAKEINGGVEDAKNKPKTEQQTELMRFSVNCLGLILIYGENEMQNKPHNIQITQMTIMKKLKHLRAKYAVSNDTLVIQFHKKVSEMINDLERQRLEVQRAASKRAKKEKRIRVVPFGRF